MQIYLHQTHHTIGDFEQIFGDLELILKGSAAKGLHLFPETYLTGYPLQDLVLQRSFIETYLSFREKLETSVKSMPKNEDLLALVGAIEYDFDEEGLPLHITNVMLKIIPGVGIESIYTKCLLPNYDIFDEEKYFTPGKDPAVLKFKGKNIGLMICEDMWFSTTHDFDPTNDLFAHCKKKKIQLDLIVNLSASPWFLGKHKNRLERASEIASLFGCPFAYVNRVGGEDEIQFDGGSFISQGEKLAIQGKFFEEDLLAWELGKFQGTRIEAQSEAENTWESLFSPLLDHGHNPPILPPLSDQDCEELIHGIGQGIQEYARKCGFKNFLVALSGGMDSALVLAILHLIKRQDQKVEAIYMPGFFNSTISYDLSHELCANLNIPLKSLPIKFFHSAIRNAFQDVFKEEMIGLTDENIQSRLRGALLYARSNQTGNMVINTSNKSELAVGYSTQYGDSVGAISMLGDLYKTEVFELARYINKKYDNLIPVGIIERPPSAELKEDQEDSQSLPPYKRLDAMLEGFLSYRLSPTDLVKIGFPKEEVEKVYGLYMKSEYKRTQFCPILKVRAKSFGFGYRVPITKKF